MHNMRMFFTRFAQRLNFKNLKQHYSLHGQLNAIMHFTHLRSKHFYPTFVPLPTPRYSVSPR